MKKKVKMKNQQQTKQDSKIKHSKEEGKITLKSIVMFLLGILGVNFLVKISIEIIDIPIGGVPYLIATILFLLAFILIKPAKPNHLPIDNWETWCKFSKSKIIKLSLLFFSVSPLIVKFSSQIDIDNIIPYSIYTLWYSGLACLIAIFIYEICAPKPFQYTNYAEFEKSDKSIFIFKKDIDIVLNKLDTPSENAKKLEFEILLKSDKPEDVFYFLRRELSIEKSIARFIVAQLLLTPAYCFFVLLWCNALTVSYGLSKKIQQDGGLSCALQKSLNIAQLKPSTCITTKLDLPTK